jgi:hypothetical protein
MAAVPYSFGYSNTTVVERQPLYSSSVWWTGMNDFPADPSGSGSLLVQRANCRFETSVSGSTTQFICSSGTSGTTDGFSAMIPGNFGNGVSYQPQLTASGGVRIPYNPSLWVADSDRGLLQFTTSPILLGYTTPYTLNYWQYTQVGNVVVPGNLTACGLLTASGLIVQNSTIVIGPLTVCGLLTASGLTVRNASTMIGPLTACGLLTASGLTVQNASTMIGPLTACGLLTASGLLVENSARINGNLDVIGAAPGYSLTVTGSGIIYGSLTVCGTTTTVNTIVTTIAISGDTTIGANLTICGITTALGPLISACGLIVQRETVAIGPVTACGLLTVVGPLTACGMLTTSGLTVLNASTMVGPLTA